MKLDRDLKNIMIATAFGVCLYVFLTNLGTIWEKAADFLKLMRPVLAGGVLAFILNVPMGQIEGLLTRISGKRGEGRSFRAPALILTLLVVLALIAVLFWSLIPQLVESSVQVIQQMQTALPRLEQLLRSAGISSTLLEYLEKWFLNDDFIQKFTKGLGDMLGSVIGTVSSAAGQFVNGLMALILMAYFLLGKEMLSRQITMVLKKLCPVSVTNRILEVGRELRDTYAKFFSGQCMEAFLLGLMIFTAFTLFRLPYALLVAVLTAFTSFIPYVGAFLSCGVAALLILMISPWKALLAVAVYQVVQFCENQFVYPRAVGNAVGLPALYTILAVFIGGALFGVMGMIFFIPLMATAYNLARRLYSESGHTEQAGADGIE